LSVPRVIAPVTLLVVAATGKVVGIRD